MRDNRKDLHSKGTVNKRIGRRVQNDHSEGNNNNKKDVCLFQITVIVKAEDTQELFLHHCLPLHPPPFCWQKQK